MQLKVSKMLAWLLNKVDSGNMHAHAATLVGGPSDLAQRVRQFISDRKVAKLKEIKAKADERAQALEASRLREEQKRMPGRDEHEPMEIDSDNDEEVKEGDKLPVGPDSLMPSR